MRGDAGDLAGLLHHAVGGHRLAGERDDLGGGPQKVGVAVADLFTGMYATVAILAALRHAERTGKGQAIDMALLDAQVAMLANLGVAVRDETGWKLSTTRAAASIMSLLRAAAWDVSSDAMLDWLKNAPVFDAAAVTSAEKELRKDGLRQWRQVSQGIEP